MANTVILYHSSKRTGNTKKVIDAISKEINCELINIDENPSVDISKFENIVFASGVYAGKFSRKLLKFIKSQKTIDKKCYLVFTSGGGFKSAVKNIKKILNTKNSTITSEFSCLGRDAAFTIFKKTGGFLKSKPDAQDLENAISWVKSLNLN